VKNMGTTSRPIHDGWLTDFAREVHEFGCCEVTNSGRVVAHGFRAVVGARLSQLFGSCCWEFFGWVVVVGGPECAGYDGPLRGA
jgi:hypothetical protein